MSISKWLAVLALVSTSTISLLAETRCPGNVESLPYRMVSRHQIVVSVSINHSRPYLFLFDTGAQMTMIDSSLAGELHLVPSGNASVKSGGVKRSGSVAEVSLVQAGANQVADLRVIVFDIGIEQGKSRDVRGILGEDFLERFDVLIDNEHRLVCLDDSGRMRLEVKGRHLELLSPVKGTANSLPKVPVVAVGLSDARGPVRLELDSGADSCFLFNGSIVGLGASTDRPSPGYGASAQLERFRIVRPQNMKIGSDELPRVRFMTFFAVWKGSYSPDYDGLLSLGLFKRVFIDHADRYAVLDPW